MLTACPSCGARFSLDALIADADAREAVRRALESGDLGRAAVRYLACFRPGERALSWARTRRLLDEVLDAVEAGRVERRGRSFGVGAAVWREALEAVAAARDAGSLDLPLKNHGYLFEVAARIAERRAGEAEVRADEERRAAGRREAAGREEREGDAWASLEQYGAARPPRGNTGTGGEA